MPRAAICGFAIAIILLNAGGETFASCACGPNSHLASVTDLGNGATFCYCPCNKGYVDAGPAVWALHAVSRGCVARRSGADRKGANSRKREAADSIKQTKVSKQPATANAGNGGPAFCDPSGKCTPAPSVAPPQSSSSSCGGLSVGPGATAIGEESCSPGNLPSSSTANAGPTSNAAPTNNVNQSQPEASAPAPSVAPWMDVLQTALVGPSAEAETTNLFGGTGCPIMGCTQPQPTPSPAASPPAIAKQSNAEPVTAKPAPGAAPTSPSPVEGKPVDERAIDMVLNDPHACPASQINPIDVNADCNPNFQRSQACDQNFEAPSTAWQACYADISACRTNDDALNTKIHAYNLRYSKCHQKAAGD